ncbi:MAG: hypothetical protein DMG11_34250 [Acidobacteria bacterium]|nr:MAG: hypothetical protein DMG11_34250 [Acidobacteriota bacterium]
MALLRDRTRDEELVRACLNGDQLAWAELIRSYQRLIYSVARVLCPDDGDADEIFQQVCLELYQASLPRWLVIVTRRQSVTFLRNCRRTSNLEEHLPGESRIEAIEHLHAVERALEQMPERCRRLLTELYLSEDSSTYATIAERMRIPIASIGPTRGRCLEKLRAILRAT